MPDADHAPDFWRSVATTFAGNHSLLFDLYNEPHGDISWDCWLNGCSMNQYYDGNVQLQSATWQSVGMQALVDAVRGTGANNVIILGGLNWSDDMSGWLAHKPNDPANQLAASLMLS